MSEETQNDDAALPQGEAPAADAPADGPDASLPTALRDVNPERLAEIRAKLARFVESRGKTVSGSEAPDQAPVTPPATAGVEGDKPTGSVMTGEDVDWSEYDLDYNVRHLYPRAAFRQTGQGPKWVAMLDEFFTTEKDTRSHGKEVNAPGTVDGTEKEPQNLGEYLTQMVNGREGWRIAALLPGGTGRVSVVMQKQSPYVLPDPIPLKKDAEVAVPTEPELQQVEDSAIEFMREEGLAPLDNSVVVSETDNGLRPATDVELDETVPGAHATARFSGVAVTHALDLNAQTTEQAPNVPQPPSADGIVAPGVEHIRKHLPGLLDGPDFGSV